MGAGGLGSFWFLKFDGGHTALGLPLGHWAKVFVQSCHEEDRFGRANPNSFVRGVFLCFRDSTGFRQTVRSKLKRLLFIFHAVVTTFQEPAAFCLLSQKGTT